MSIIPGLGGREKIEDWESEGILDYPVRLFQKLGTENQDGGGARARRIGSWTEESRVDKQR